MINLLPPKIKKEQKIKKLSVQISGAMLTLLIMVVMTYSAVYFVNFFLDAQLTKNKQQLDETKVEISKLKSIEDDVNTINQKLGKLETLDKDRVEWSAFFKEINSSIPEKVLVNSIQVDKTKKTFSISAAAETRADIVKLQAKLEEMELLKSLSFQSSVFDEKNGFFTFSMYGSIEK
ncbi:MAG: hypothetical protein BWY19_00049 [bacterium ADurb.Bin212]|nr:MAG: hypothetical protein BWY19_00049 [bacterium ADurb.Bin212]